MKRILVIQLQQIGDVLLSTAICATLKKNYPEASIDYLVADFAEGIVRGHPAISEVISYNKKGGFIYFFSFLLQLRKKKYDVVIDILCKPRSGFMAYFSGAKKRISFSRKGRSFFYTDLLPGSLGLKLHTIDHRLTLLKPLSGKIIEDKTVKIYLEDSLVDNTEKMFLKLGLDASSLKIVFGVNSRRSFKVWPREHFIKVIDFCINKYNAKIIFFL
jgi:ADP-heptose:LPS heptosyltransferase